VRGVAQAEYACFTAWQMPQVFRADELACDLGTRRSDSAQPITGAARTDLPGVSGQRVALCLGREWEAIRALDRE